MFAASVPVALQALDRGLVLLDHATPAVLSARLHPDMFDCAAQFQTVAGFALRATLPLAGQPVPEMVFSDGIWGLREGLEAASLEIKKLTPDDFLGAADRRITHRAGFADLDQSGHDYLYHFALPNLWFHLSMVFAIMRAQGIEVGKADFDGLHQYPAGFSWKD